MAPGLPLRLPMSKTTTPKNEAGRGQGRKPGGAKGRVSRRRARPAAGAKSRTARGAAPQMWSAPVTRGSNALDLEPNVFTKASPAAIARSLKRSAEQSRRRKAGPFQSAMSMLNFYINRAGRNLPRARLQVLERAKGELRRAFGRDLKPPQPRRRPSIGRSRPR
jgi:hypothetical protein